MSALLSPRMVLLHSVAIVAVGAAGWLGAWQVGAWHENRQDKAAELVDAPPLPLDDVLGPDATFEAGAVGQPVSLSGQWLGDDTVYVADRPGGYWVVTPVATRSGSAILVVRGSSPSPPAAVPSGSVSVTGWLQPGDAGSVADDEPGDDVLPSLRIADVVGRMDQDLYGGYVIAAQPLEPGLSPVTPDQLPEPGLFTGVRNLLYGVEWWVFGAFAAFLWWRWCRDEVERVRSRTTAGESGEAPVASQG